MSIEYNETKFIFGNELANCYLKTKSDEEKARLEHKIKQKKKHLDCGRRQQQEEVRQWSPLKACARHY